jgi:hypothetical protein
MVNTAVASARKYLEDELGVIVDGVAEITGGRTNKLYCLSSRDGRKFIVKHYFQDGVDRLEREFEALTYLAAKGFVNIPKACHRNSDLGYAIYSFESGKILPFKNERIQQVDKEYLNHMVDFLAALHAIRPHKDNSHFPKALHASHGVGEYVDAILSSLNHVQNKSLYLAAFDHSTFALPKIVSFVRSEVTRILKEAATKSLLGRLDSKDLRLSPVDFGSHNILVHDGTLTFLDFEEFGWDDPMQVVAYPTPALTPTDRDYFIKRYISESPLGSRDTDRLPVIMQLRSLDWLSRLLLGLTPLVIEKRRFALGDSFELNAYVVKQCSRIEQQLENYKLSNGQNSP